MEEQRGARVVGHVDVGPAVVVVVEHEGGEAEGRRGLQDTSALRHVRERAVRVAVVEDVRRAPQSGGAAHDDEALPGAVLSGCARRVANRVVVGQVRGDEEVQAAVAVVVEEGAARAVAIGRDQARRPRRVAEDAPALVPVQHALAVVGDEQVHAPVVVVVAGADALAPAGISEAGLRCDVIETDIAPIPI